MEKLHLLQKQSNKTILQVSKELDININTYKNYLRGMRQPDIETLKKISQYFRVSIDEIVGNDITPFVSIWQLSEEQQANLYLIQKLSTKYNLIANGVLLRLFQEQQNEVV